MQRTTYVLLNRKMFAEKSVESLGRYSKPCAIQTKTICTSINVIKHNQTGNNYVPPDASVAELHRCLTSSTILIHKIMQLVHPKDNFHLENKVKHTRKLLV